MQQGYTPEQISSLVCSHGYWLVYHNGRIQARTKQTWKWKQLETHECLTNSSKINWNNGMITVNNKERNVYCEEEQISLGREYVISIRYSTLSFFKYYDKVTYLMFYLLYKYWTIICAVKHFQTVTLRSTYCL